MTPEQALDWLAEDNGIVGSYHDLAGMEQPTSRETKIVLLRANGLDLTNDTQILQEAKHWRRETRNRIFPEEIILDAGDTLTLPVPEGTPWNIQTETDNNSELGGRSNGRLDVDSLPIGLHRLEIGKVENAERIRLIVAPAAAPSITQNAGQQHIWGLNLALYGLHSSKGPGIGNFHDLARVAQLAGQQGASFLGINPVHALGWHNREIISPYSPSHRGFLNTRHIAANQIEPHSQSSLDLISKWNAVHQKTTDGARVDYSSHVSNLQPLLEKLYQDFATDAAPKLRQDFYDFCRRGGSSLARFTQFEHFSGVFGTEWTDWPEDSLGSDPVGPNTSPDIKFHAWLQWIAHQQLATAQQAALSSGMEFGLYLDLAVGARRNGAEALCESESIAQGVSVGAPPDHLSPAGQNWNLAAFAPKKLAQNNYQAFRNILRQTMRRCGIIRIDHVLGLNRTFWIPDDGSAGGYIKQNFKTLMALVRIEAHRSNTIVVGEDLGLVPEGFREAMNGRNIYSYGVLQYEKDHNNAFRAPENFRQKSLVCFGTHDTPTLAGYQQARDVDWWHRLGWIDEHQAHHSRSNRAREVEQLLALAGDAIDLSEAGFDQLRHAVYTVLAQSNAAMVSVQLDDLFATIEAQNLPGTTTEHPNWQRKYPCSTEQLKTDPQLVKIARIMADHARAPLAERKQVQ